jgi:hypothetical protein
MLSKILRQVICGHFLNPMFDLRYMSLGQMLELRLLKKTAWHKHCNCSTWIGQLSCRLYKLKKSIFFPIEVVNIYWLFIDLTYPNLTKPNLNCCTCSLLYCRTCRAIAIREIAIQAVAAVAISKKSVQQSLYDQS